MSVLQNGSVATAQCFANPQDCYFIPQSAQSLGVVTLNGTTAVNINTSLAVANQSIVMLQPQGVSVGFPQVISIANGLIVVNSSSASDTAVKCGWLCANPYV